MKSLNISPPKPQARRQLRRRPGFEFLEDRVHPGDALAGYFVAGLGLIALPTLSGHTDDARGAPDSSNSRVSERQVSLPSNGRFAGRPRLNETVS